MAILSVIVLLLLWTFWDWFRLQLKDIVYTLAHTIAAAIEDAKKR